MRTWQRLSRSLGVATIAVVINAALIGLVFYNMSQRTGIGPAANPGSRVTAGDHKGKLARRETRSSRAETARGKPAGASRGVVIERGVIRQENKPGDSQFAFEAETEVAGNESVASLVADPQGEARSPEEGQAKPTLPDRRADALAEYASRRATAGEAANAQKQLAIWCDSHGLWDQAKPHWETVIRHSPNNAEARKRLGYRLRQDQWVADAALAEDMVQKKANSYWAKELASDHKRMHPKGKGRDADRIHGAAVARIEAVRDPRAVPSFWDEFAGDHRHHGLTVAVLSQITSKQTSQKLAALAVYSLDEKARAAAVRALQRRDPAEFREILVKLMNAPLRYDLGQVSDPQGGQMRVLLIEGEKANRQFLYPTPGQPDAFSGMNPSFVPGIASPAQARQFNREQEQMAKALSDQQVESDIAAVKALNESIKALNERVAQVLRSTCRARFGPDPEAWRQWLARSQGTTYQPPDSRAKPMIAQVVEPLYRPSFVRVPASC